MYAIILVNVCLAPGAPPRLTGLRTLWHTAGTIAVYDSSFVLAAVACFGACTWSLIFDIGAAKVGLHYLYNLPFGKKLDPPLLDIVLYVAHMERGSSVVKCRTSNQVSPGSSPSLLPIRKFAIFVLSIDAPVHSAV